MSIRKCSFLVGVCHPALRTLALLCNFLFCKNGLSASGFIAMRSEMGFQLVVCQDTGFLETIHAFSDLHVGIAFGVKVGISEAIFAHDFRSDILGVVLEDFHSGTEKEVLEIGSAIASTVFGIRDDSIEVEFGVNDTNSRGVDILKGMEMITANSHANTIDIRLAGNMHPWK